eukprot:m.1670786 g.1670786  ORF g.1670786 m.1670786 type:complete len:77 (+) comp168477_c0_seq1:163-393(+)
MIWNNPRLDRMKFGSASLLELLLVMLQMLSVVKLAIGSGCTDTGTAQGFYCLCLNGCSGQYCSSGTVIWWGNFYRY